MTDEFILSFVSEARELLNQLESDLLLLEKSPEDQEIIGNIFRVMHNIKGAARMYGFDDVQNLSHLFENIFDRLRSGSLKTTKALINDTLHGKDILMAMLERAVQPEENRQFLEKLKMQFDEKTEESSGATELTTGSGSADQGVFCILFSPDVAVFERGLNPEKTIRELNAKGRSKIVLHESDGTWQEQLEKRICHTVWEIYVKGVSRNEMEEVFLFYDEDEYRIFSLADPDSEPEQGMKEFFQRYYPDLTFVSAHLRTCISSLIPDGQNIEISVPKTLNIDWAEEESTEYVPKLHKESSIKVSSQKLDELLNLVSELVIISATLEARTSVLGDVHIGNSIENLEKLTKKFRSNALDLRLVPVGNLLKKFNRQVRDLSDSLGKKVNLFLDGQETEIDKSILKAIESPLMHILRNSIDHGIETPEVRLQKGKSAEGRIKISAFYSGANVIIQVHDDGLGMDLDKIRRRAEEQGYITGDQQITDKELIRLIMEPGFTTREKVSMVSGRGVGMDIVKMELNAIGGSVEIETEKDLGTSITLRLPTTLSIIDTLLLEVDGSYILVPLLEVEYCYKESRNNLHSNNSSYLQYKNNMVPYISLRRKFNSPPCENEDEMVIIISKYDKKYAILADDILGEQQAVIKPLGDLFANQPYYSGGSIMADGNLALVLDTNHLFNQSVLN